MLVFSMFVFYCRYKITNSNEDDRFESGDAVQSHYDKGGAITGMNL